MSDDNSATEEIEDVLDEDQDAMALIETLRAENAALKEQVMRYAAEADNTKRRAEREVNDARAYAIQKFARDLLGAADNMSRALAAAPADAGDPAVKNFVLGVQMIDKDLQAAFERNGLKRVDPAKGSKFDPHQHQAMMEEDSTEVAAGTVANVLAPGYELFGRIVRPAMVVVASKASKGGGSAEPSGTNPYADGGDGAAGASVDTRA